MNSNLKVYEYTIDASKAVSILGAHLFADSRQFLRELVSNSLDACSNLMMLENNVAPTVEIISDRQGICVRDFGCGMPRETMEVVLPSFFSSTKSSREHDEIGEFGIGLYSALRYASKIVVKSCSSGLGHGSIAVLTDDRVEIGDVTMSAIGTVVEVFFKSNVPPDLRDSGNLKAYLGAVFCFSNFDILYDGDLIGGPSLYKVPWHTVCEGKSWLPAEFLGQEKAQGFIALRSSLSRHGSFDPPKVVREFIVRSGEADYCLYFSDKALTEKSSLALFNNRVFVEDFPNISSISNLRKFVAGIIHGRSISLTLDRQSVIQDSGKFVRIVDEVSDVVIEGLKKFHRSDSAGFKLFALEHRDSLFHFFQQNHRFLKSLLLLMPFKDLRGEWITIKNAARNSGVLKYTLEFVQPVRHKKRDRVIVFRSEEELKILDHLKAGEISGFELEMVRKKTEFEDGEPDPLSAIATELLPDALFGDEDDMTQPKRIDIIEKLDARSAWFSKEPQPDIDLNNLAEEISGELGASRSRGQFEREYTQRGFRPVLILNRKSDIVDDFIEKMTSSRSSDRDLAILVLKALLSVARCESCDDWGINWDDFKEYQKRLEELIRRLIKVETSIAMKGII